MRDYPLTEGDELDLICWNEYGELPGALEAVLRANWAKLHLFDKLGIVMSLERPESIVLPDLARPTETSKTLRIFD